MTAGETLSALWAHARPKFSIYLLLLVLAGYGWAHWDRALTVRNPGPLVLVLLGWWLLNAGTLWLNAELDQDEGPVLLGTRAARPPHLWAWGYGALALAVGIVAIAHPLAGLACGLSAGLAVLYSHPRTVWKGHPLGGPLVNGLGYGLLTPLAGWAVVDVSPTPRTLVVWGLGLIGVLGCYFSAQAFQGPEDAARGYRTLVVTHGPEATIGAARALVAAALLGACALAVVGWIPRACLVIAPLALWNDAWFRAWLAQPGGGTEASAREMARRLLLTGLAGFALATVVYLNDSFQGRPVAGLGTAAGHPADRPLLSPAAMRAWERWSEGRAAAALSLPQPPPCAAPAPCDR